MPLAALNWREAKSDGSTMGCVLRRSTTTNTTPSATPSAPAPSESPTPSDSYWMSANVSRPSARLATTAPTTSNERLACSSRVSGTCAWAIQMVMAPSGTFTRNAHRQLANCTSHPPTNGPMAEATPPSPDHEPIALPRSSGRNDAWIIARLPGVSSAPPTPCRTRARMSCSGDCASPQAAEAMVNHVTPMTKMRRRPKRSPRDPPSRMSDARASR